MKYRLFLVFCIVLLLASTAFTHPQSAPADLTLNITGVGIEKFPQVNVTFTVRDANGVSISGLGTGDFIINEDRKPETNVIELVATEINPELPVSLVVVFDVSGSMAGQPLADAKVAARGLIEQLGKDDEVAFIAFSGAVNLDGVNSAYEHLPTTMFAPITQLIDGLEAGGGTSLYDALYKGVKWSETTTLGHRAVILLTDGVDEDPGSRVASDDTPLNEATRNNIPIFTIGLGSQIDQGYLERAARITGGIYQETPDSAQLTELFLNVLDRLKEQYVVTYKSEVTADAGLHQVQVNVDIEGRKDFDFAEFSPIAQDSVLSPTIMPSPVIVTSSLTLSPTIVSSSVPPVGGVDESADRSSSRGIVLGILAGILLLATFIWLMLRRAKRSLPSNQNFCKHCGRALKPGEVCPDCFPDTGSFKKPPV